MRKIIEGYTLEIISRSQTIQVRCKKLLSKNFASPSPKVLAKTLIEMCGYLEEATKSIYKSINWDSVNEIELKTFINLLQSTDALIQELGSHMRYIDAARTERLPWSIVNPIKEFVKTFMPEIEIMLRSQWRYNYAVVTADLKKAYEEALIEYQDYVPSIPLDKVFMNLERPFYIISFPSLEKNNILLHCLMGHEIGHLISGKYLEKLGSDIFLGHVSKEIIEIVKSEQTDEQLHLFTQIKFQREIERAISLWRRGLEEILSDIIGTLLFGPAILFSALEIAIQNEMDHEPTQDNEFYPPWRFRLREIQKVILDSSQQFIPLPEGSFAEKTIQSVNERYELIKEITAKEDDKKIIRQDPITKIAYREIEKDITDATIHFKNNLLGDSIIKSSDLYKRLQLLIERIDYGIPPNAYEDNINSREPATIVEIINAAWFHKIAWEEDLFNKKDASFNEDICKKRDRMNRLTLKAIEYSDIEKEYRSKMGVPPQFEIKSQ